MLEHAAVGVDGDGVIRWVDGDAGGIDGDGGGVRRVVERNGWGGVVEVEVVGCEGDGEGWFFPGFVGRFDGFFGMLFGVGLLHGEGVRRWWVGVVGFSVVVGD